MPARHRYDGQSDADGGVTVRETTTVTAPRIVLGYMAKHAELAHARTFSLLAGELAGG